MIVQTSLWQFVKFIFTDLGRPFANWARNWYWSPPREIPSFVSYDAYLHMKKYPPNVHMKRQTSTGTKKWPPPCPPPPSPPQSSWGERTPGTLLVVQCWLQQLCDSSNNVIFSNKLLHFSYKSLNVPSEKTIFLRNLCRLFPVLQHRCFPVNIAKFLITPVSKNICIWLLLKIIIKKNFLEKPLVTMIIKW